MMSKLVNKALLLFLLTLIALLPSVAQTSVFAAPQKHPGDVQ